jgi:hypothetical protein
MKRDHRRHRRDGDGEGELSDGIIIALGSLARHPITTMW